MVISPHDCRRLTDRGLYSTPERLCRFLDFLFGTSTASSRNFLDIGGGSGLLTFAACLQGAASADCVDPEGAGSAAGSTRSFEDHALALGLPQARLHRSTFQEFSAPPAHYDLVFVHNAVNHLDEAACIELHRSEAARACYRAIFEKLRGLMRPGARLVVSDCARSNVFGDLGLRSPFVPTIEWHKHQNPGTWISVIESARFRTVRLQWSSPNSLGKPGRLLGNRLIAYLLLGHFRLEFVAS